MPFRLKLAVVMGATPLLVGTLIYATWRITRWGWLEEAGIYTIGWGLLAFAIGAIALLSHLFHVTQRGQSAERASETQHHEKWLSNALLVGGLLLLNFPAALFYTLSAIEVMTRYTVTIYNTSDQSVESLVLAGPSVRLQVGPLSPDAQVRHRLDFHGNGPLMFEARQVDSEFGGVVDDYVAGSIGGDVSLTIRNDGEFEVTRNFD